MVSVQGIGVVAGTPDFSYNIRLHQELGRRPRQPATSGKVVLRQQMWLF